MHTIKKANEQYKNGNYDKAYDLYIAAKKQYGFKSLDINISQCLKMMKRVNTTITRQIKNTDVPSIKKNYTQNRLIKDFDEEAYLKTNSELEDIIEDVEIYLDKNGLNEIEQGKKKFHVDFEPFSEKTYLEVFPEVEAMVKEGEFISAFEHFCKAGYSKIIADNKNVNLEDEEKISLSIMKNDTAIENLEPYYFTDLQLNPGSFVTDAPVKRKSSLKIAVSIHVSDIDMLPEIINYIKNIPYRYDLFITVDESKREETEKLFSSFGKISKIIIVNSEEGDDVSFIKTLSDIVEGGYDIVCKIHTKKSIPDFDEHNLWLKLLIEPLLGSSDTVKKVVSAFEQDKRLGILGSASLFKSLQKTMNGNEKQYTDIINVIDSSLDPAAVSGFFAGSMFWANVDTLFPLYEKSTEVLDTFKMDTPGEFKEKVKYSDHALERIFGILPRISNMRTALCYATDKNRIIYNVQIIEGTLLHKYLSPLGVKTTLECEKNIETTLQVIKNTSEFKKDFYIKEVPEVDFLKMEPLYHYCRYGFFYNCSPNPLFSSFGYLTVNHTLLNWITNPLEHYIKNHHMGSIITFPPSNNVKSMFGYIRESNLFDPRYYLREYPDVLKIGINALFHYCMYGWKEDRFPSAAFDPVWYTSEYLSDSLEPINPLLHYILVGQFKNYLPKMKSKKLDITKGIVFTDREPSRICLFAGYDSDGIVDDYVIDFIKELSEYSDVYYLMDNNVDKKELKKLSPYVKKAWAFRHGEYDFGSYSRLAKDLVGWESIERYDELLLVNDSSYLIRPLGDVFNEMDKRKCDWWGMQATKGMFATKECESNMFKEKISIDIVKEKYLKAYEKDEIYDFHIGSYFLVYRKNVISSDVFRRILNNVKKEKKKKNIIFRYEFGLTKQLIYAGFNFDTYIKYLYPLHPVYTNNIFNMIEEGYPFFKRFLLTENHYKVEELGRWKEKLIEMIPDLDVGLFEKNLQRVSDQSKLLLNLNISADEKKSKYELLTNDAFKKLDKESVVDNNLWIFPVCAFNHNFDDNTRAVFEEVKNDKTIKKVILYRSKFINVEGVNVEVLPLHSRKGQEALLHSGVIFIKHTVWRNVVFPIDTKKHKCINLWHGIPLKRIGYASFDMQSKLNGLKHEHQKFFSVIASSTEDRMAMAAAFYPLSYNDVWITGLPRHDFILRKKSKLPFDLQTEMKKLKTELKGRKLILFAPTFRNDSEDGYYFYTVKEKRRLYQLLEDNDTVLGIREHMADSKNAYSNELKSKNIIDLSSKKYPNIEILYRLADILITDYSSCFIDFMLTGKPMLSFAYDLEKYAEKERGFFYDIEMVFPGKICQDFDSLHKNLGKILVDPVANKDPHYDFKRRKFFDYMDDENSQRVVDKVKEIINK